MVLKQTRHLTLGMQWTIRDHLISTCFEQWFLNFSYVMSFVSCWIPMAFFWHLLTYCDFWGDPAYGGSLLGFCVWPANTGHGLRLWGLQLARAEGPDRLCAWGSQKKGQGLELLWKSGT
jgi:hypothetical protein